MDHRDKADRDDEAVDEVVAREAEEDLVGDEARQRRRGDRDDDGERVGDADVVGHEPADISADCHEGAEREVDDAGDAEGQRHPEGDDAVEGADDDAVQQLADEKLGHGYFGETCVTLILPPFWMSTMSKLITSSPVLSKRVSHSP